MSTETSAAILWVIPVLPLLGAVVLLLAGRRSDRWGHLVACVMAAGSFCVGMALMVGMAGRRTDDRPVHRVLFTWLQVGPADTGTGGLTVNMGLYLDQLSICFVLLITGVGTLIHIYSIGYMADDPDRRRFFAYLNLFLAAMLVLVLADSYLGLYLGWEGVGLASYLLIGFWQQRRSAATAAKKAFVVNRVGDIGLAVALMVMFTTFGSVTFGTVFAGAESAGHTVTTALGFLLLLAACGKSAQVPLQSWLGDAMEGPTPVSALIHAATMVTAGVYLIVRSAPIFDLAPDARLAVATVGTVTLLFGAIIGCAKDDIKKALAASTMSQIGYMMLAAGLGPAGYVFAIMHLLTHGFFKAGLFLGAGSVMHAMNDDTDMRRFGGLRTVMPITFVTFGIGYLALIGVPPFAGFFSKDPIIEAAFGVGGARGVVLGCAALLGAGITAFYMTRMMLMTFFGKRRWAPDAHPHEAPATMTGPMVLIALGSAASGALLVAGDSLMTWLAPVVGEHHPELPVPTWVLTVGILVVVGIGVVIAWMGYARKDIPLIPPQDVSALTVAARRDLYGDAVNERVLMRPGRTLATGLDTLESVGIDGAGMSIGTLVTASSHRIRGWQNGFVRSYALSMLAGATVVVAAVMVVRGL